MNNKTKLLLNRTRKAIKLFGNIMKVEYLDTQDITINKGRIQRIANKISLNLTVLNKRQKYNLFNSLNNNSNIYNYDFEAFYLYDNDKVKEIVQNDFIYIDDVKYRVNKVENNYKIFQRLELTKDEYENTE